ncbi:MAG: alpha/beta hydrolase [Chloroflexi bacterium]|nr:MAG: alpha/beta hydrolase [Chloroflexota bacterium]
MATYVLVHGATGGGWQMRPLAVALQAAGHYVQRPTLTGLGERSHLLRPEIDLATHVQDIVNVLQYEDLHEVILVGKSYSGIVITGVAEQTPERLAHLVYLDALVPGDRQSFLEILGPEVAERMAERVRERGDGWRLPADRSVEPRLADHPFGSLTQRIALSNPAAARLPRTYIRCTAVPAHTPHARVTAASAQRAVAAGWRYRELPADHNPESVPAPELVQFLLELAG